MQQPTTSASGRTGRSRHERSAAANHVRRALLWTDRYHGIEEVGRRQSTADAVVSYRIAPGRIEVHPTTPPPAVIVRHRATAVPAVENVING
jgi:hypothetical protein